MDVIPLRSRSKYQYVIVPANPPRNCTFLSLHNKIYEFWDKTWTEAFAKTGAPNEMWHENFLRQDLITAILDGNEVVGCHLYTLYNVNSLAAISNEYFHYFTESSLGTLKENGMPHIMSMEYLCVNPLYRKSISQVPFGEVLIGLGAEVTDAVGYNCCLGTTIDEAKVDLMAQQFGGISIQDSIKKYGYSLRLMVIPMKGRKHHPNPDLKNLINFSK